VARVKIAAEETNMATDEDHRSSQSKTTTTAENAGPETMRNYPPPMESFWIGDKMTQSRFPQNREEAQADYEDWRAEYANELEELIHLASASNTGR